MSSKSDELNLDMTELQQLLCTATRSNVKDFLQTEISRIQKEIAVIKAREERKNETKAESPTTISATPQLYNVDLQTYGWDQSEKFMKIYVTLNGVQNIDKESVKCEFTDRSFKMVVSNLNNKNHRLHVGSLYSEIIPDGSSFKVKTDMVVIMLKKKEAGKTWAYVTEREQKTKEKKTPKVDEEKDPNESLMDMLKKMYDDGDDEMKRTIGKAWTESREKQGTD